MTLNFPGIFEMKFSGNITMELSLFVCVLGWKDERVIWLVMLHILYYCEQLTELPFEARDIKKMRNFRGQKA